MFRVLAMSDEPCDWTGATDDVVQFKAVKGSLSGNIAWSELLTLIKRKSQEATKENGTKKPQTPATTVPVK